APGSGGLTRRLGRPKFCALLVPRLCTARRHHVGRREIERERLVQTISWVWWVSPRLLSLLFGPFTWVRLPAPPLFSSTTYVRFWTLSPSDGRALRGVAEAIEQLHRVPRHVGGVPEQLLDRLHRRARITRCEANCAEGRASRSDGARPCGGRARADA